MKKGVFNQVPMFVQMKVALTFVCPIAARWNYRFHALLDCLLDNCVAIVALVGNQMLSLESFNEGLSLRAIRTGSLCDNDSERHTMRIHGQMNLGVEPPFVRLIP